jgi:flagellar biosynthesis protein FlhB
VQLLIGMVKLVMLSAVAYSAVHAHIEEIMGVQALTFTQIFGLGTTVVYTIALRVGIAMLVLAIIEYLYQRWRIEKELKMSKQEVKEEMRRMEGDPKIKQRRRQIAVQQLKKRLKKDVPTADVVVTNPTEFAIALKYDAGTMHAPRVVAKGQGLIAQHIREIAIAAGVPILERKPLARALYKLVEVGQEIPEEFYSAVAEILAYVYELSGKMRQPGTAFEAVAAR